MARKFCVISTYGTGPTGERLKKSVAQLLVRRLFADWVRDKSGAIIGIRRRELAAIPADAVFAKVSPSDRPVITEFMSEPYAACELPGIRFVPPKTDPRPPIGAIRAGWDWTREPDYLRV